MRPAFLLSLTFLAWMAAVSTAPALTKGPGDGAAKPAAPSEATGAPAPALALPGGSWAKTCGGASVTRQFEMTATCSAPDAPPATSTLKLTDCAQPAMVGSKDGRLVCENGPRSAPTGGAWTESCIGESMKDRTLTAQCLTADGRLTEASIDLSTCAPPADVVANDGKLACAQPAVASPAAAAPSLPTASEAGLAPNAFAGAWDIKTERGDSLDLTIKQDGTKATGSVAFKKDTLTFTGHVDDGGKLQLVWQLGHLTGTGTLALTEDGKRLKGVIVLADGGAVAGGTWDSLRAAATAAAALPLGETGAKPEGFVDGVITGTVVVRDGPTTKGTKILDTLQRGDKVSVKCAANGWCELSEGGRYVARTFVRLGGSPPKTAASKPAKKVAVAKKKSTGTAKETPPPPPGGFIVPGLIITFGHHGNGNQN
jgi:hypothetical protein